MIPLHTLNLVVAMVLIGQEGSILLENALEKILKFQEGGKNVTFLTYDGTYGKTDKVLDFI